MTQMSRRNYESYRRAEDAAVQEQYREDARQHAEFQQSWQAAAAYWGKQKPFNNGRPWEAAGLFRDPHDETDAHAPAPAAPTPAEIASPAAQRERLLRWHRYVESDPRDRWGAPRDYDPLAPPDWFM